MIRRLSNGIDTRVTKGGKVFCAIKVAFPCIRLLGQGACYADNSSDDDQFLENLALQHSNVAPGRKIVDIILTYQKNISGRKTSYYASIDVTDLYPFLHSNLTTYIPTN